MVRVVWVPAKTVFALLEVVLNCTQVVSKVSAVLNDEVFTAKAVCFKTGPTPLCSSWTPLLLLWTAFCLHRGFSCTLLFGAESGAVIEEEGVRTFLLGLERHQTANLMVGRPVWDL